MNYTVRSTYEEGGGCALQAKHSAQQGEGSATVPLPNDMSTSFLNNFLS